MNSLAITKQDCDIIDLYRDVETNVYVSLEEIKLSYITRNPRSDFGTRRGEIDKDEIMNHGFVILEDNKNHTKYIKNKSIIIHSKISKMIAYNPVFFQVGIMIDIEA